MLFLLSSPGFMIGSVASGLLYDRYNPGYVYMISLLGAGAVCFLIPFCWTLPVMGCAMLIRSAFAGGLSTGGTCIFVTIWKSEANPFIQMLHFFFAVGALVIPLITEPFLSVRNKRIGNHSAAFFVQYVSDSGSSFEVGKHDVLNGYSPKVNDSDHLSKSYNFTTEERFLRKETDVYMSFVITGSYVIVSSLPFIVLALRRKMNILKEYKAHSVPTEEKTCKNKPKRKTNFKIRSLVNRLCVYFLICALYLAYGSIEKGCATFLMPFTVEYLFLTKTDAARLMSCFWGAFAASRFSAIIIAKFFSEFKMLLLDFIVLLGGFCVLFAASPDSIAPLWTATVMVGAGQAGIFPTAAAWINSRVTPVSGAVSAIFSVSSAIGSMIHLPLLGYLFEEVSPIWFIYLCMGFTTLCFLACIALFFTSTGRKTQVLEPNETME